MARWKQDRGGPQWYASVWDARPGNADTYDALVVDLTDVPFLDSSASLAVETVIKQVQGRDKQVFVDGVGAETGRVLDKLGALSMLSPGHRHDSRREALQAAARALEGLRLTAGS